MASKLAILTAPLLNLSIFLDELLAWHKSLNSAHALFMNTNQVPWNMIFEHEFILLPRIYFYFSHFTKHYERQFFAFVGISVLLINILVYYCRRIDRFTIHFLYLWITCLFLCRDCQLVNPRLLKNI